VDWSLFGCARKGHVTYSPDEPDLRDRLAASTAGGTAWRCLRCGAFVTHGQPGKGQPGKGQPRKGQHGSGPAAAAPLLRRGKELRDELILRVFAVERIIRFVIFAAAAYGVWRFKYDRADIQRAFNNDLPAIRTLYQDLGFNVDHSKLLGLIQHSFTLDARTLTWLRVGALVVNLLLVVYLVWSKRLFGVRGGKQAYEARLCTESFIEVEQAALAATAPPAKVPPA
jgi:uncharacterized membrane protein (DUF2068 family)